MGATRSVATHIYAENYSAEIAAYRAANIIYLATCLLTETPYERIADYNEYVGERLEDENLRILQKLKKVRPLEYAYLVKADRLLREYRK